MKKSNRQNIHRKRVWYLLILFIIIVLGIASRKFPDMVPSVFGKYPGDALWTIAVYLICCIAFPATSPVKIAFLAFIISLIDEISQLYQAAWITEIRNTCIGHVILGSAFAWADIAAYAAGALIAFLTEFYVYTILIKPDPK